MSGSQVLGPGIGDAVRGAVPPWLVPVFVVITHLGNVGLFLAAFSLDYWFGDHRRGAHALGVALAGMALIVALKALFAEPRPPQSGHLVSVSGYSFPSGHATGSTIAYGLLAFDLEVGTRRARFAVAAVLVALIALSRVVLGVHFVRDVVAGVIVGATFLAIAIAVTEHSPRPGFLMAVGVGLAAVVVSGASTDGVAIFGAALGATLGWESLDAIPAVESLKGQAVLLGGVLPGALGVGYVTAYWDVSLAVAFVLNVVVMAAVVAGPRMLARFD